MPEFKDISTFSPVTPTGNEKIQVSSAGCVTLLDIANLSIKTNWYSSLNGKVTQIEQNLSSTYTQLQTVDQTAKEALSNSENAENQVINLSNDVRSINTKISNLEDKVDNIIYEPIYENFQDFAIRPPTVLPIIGNEITYVPSSSYDDISYVSLDMDNWDKEVTYGDTKYPGSRNKSIIYYERKGGVGGLFNSWSINTTSQSIIGFYSNLAEIESMVSALDDCLVKYEIELMKTTRKQNPSEYTMSDFSFVVTGTVLTMYPNKEMLDNL